MVTNDELESDVKVPASLNLPFGKLFFGFAVVPYQPAAPADTPGSPESSSTPFTGSGHTLSGRPPAAVSVADSGSSTNRKDKSKAEQEAEEKDWGMGQTLGSRGSGGSRPQQKERSPTPDWGVDDDDVIVIDSD